MVEVKIINFFFLDLSICLLFLGIRGYMPIKVLCELIQEKYLPDIDQFDPDDKKHKKRFEQVQSQFTDQFDYFVGTSTGGLIAFCLAVNYNILEMKNIYSQSSYYFKRNRLGPFLWSKYDPSRIHAKIDEIIGTVKLKKTGKHLSAQDATLLDIHNFLNPDHMIDDDTLKSIPSSHGNLLEFVDDNRLLRNTSNIDKSTKLNHVNREKVLLITGYNTTTNTITIFNTSYAEHWPYRLADVLKATMAAPTYFPPHEVHKGIIENGHFLSNSLSGKNLSEVYIDGGVFANDPELAALWAIRMQWKKMVNYHLICIGTGSYTAEQTSSSWGGYVGWIFNQGLLVNTLMDATRSLTEIIANNLAKFHNIKRMKFNYRITQPMSLDDPTFASKFDEEWKTLKSGDDFKALLYFYENFIDLK